MLVDQFANKLRIDKGVSFQDIQELTKTALRIRGVGKNVGELIKKGFEGLFLFMGCLDNARTDKQFGAELVGCEHSVCIHLPVKFEGTVKTLIVEKLGNSAFVQESARVGILIPWRRLGEATLKNFFGPLGFPLPQ
jgi:hypothetical protein